MSKAYFVDFNRGLDTNDGLTKNTAFKTPSKISGLNFNGHSGNLIAFANDSVFEINPTKAIANNLIIDSFTGTVDNRSFITGYDYAGVTHTKPKFSYRFFPVSADWTYEATTNTYYVPFTQTSIENACRVSIGGIAVPNSYQGSQGINGFINGVTADTLRCVYDNVNRRIYLGYQGLTSGVKPNDYFGLPIEIDTGPLFFSYYLLPNVVMDGLSVENSGRLLFTGNGDGTNLNASGFEMKNCEAINSTGLFASNTNNIGLTGLFEFDLHDNLVVNAYSSSIKTYGQNIAGFIRANKIEGCGIGDTTGGGIYMQASAVAGREFYVEDNHISDAKNGIGTSSFDGAGIYLELGSSNTMVRRNTVINSYKAYQVNSGNKTSLIANVAFNCETFATLTDADGLGAADYLVAHNTFVSTLQSNIYHRGLQASTYGAIAAWGNTSTTPMVGCKIINNVFASRYAESLTESAIAAYYTNQWSVNKVTIDKNYLVGYNPSKLVSDLDFPRNDRSSSSGSITGGTPAFTSDYRLNMTSSLIGAGNTTLGQLRDNRNKLFEAKPAIGAFEKDPFINIYGVIR